ncbi:MAG: NUDIX hydrolase [Solobacterium sp.]|nr:NUDIX hydrolase [Solobacterium sp.]
MDEELKETCISSEYLYKGKILNMRHDKALVGGEVFDREVVEHPGGVGIALEDEKGRFYLVSQWRYGQNKVMKEFPAGKKEKGEEPLVTAKREIVEETGFEGEGFVHLGSLVPTPAYDTEVIELFYAKQGKFVGQHFDEDENVLVSRMTLDEIIADIMSGKIDDAKTVAMAFMIREMKRNS